MMPEPPRRCAVCGPGQDLLLVYCPGNSGPGWEVLLCALCRLLPEDPQHAPTAWLRLCERRRNPPRWLPVAPDWYHAHCYPGIAAD
ncbi:hypothetical protein [Streptomyces sp. ODS28]|uniref:hypothetical protein n=1 Tax=Streptomyces sp. ODS28 TaxID=3136688 RepID=UPI0031EB8212